MLEIDLLHLEDNMSLSLRRIIEKVVIKNRYICKINNINDVDAFLAYNVTKIPAVFINDKLISEGKLLTEEELTKLIETNLKKSDKMNKIINEILVPIDFTDTGKNTLLVAKEMSSIFGANVTVLYCNHWINEGGFAMPEGVPLATDVPDVESKVKKYVDNLMGTDFKYTARIEVGAAADIISDLSESYDFLIMGASNAPNWQKRYFGSVAFKVSHNSQCPVLLVPYDINSYDINDILFCCADNYIDEYATEFVKFIATACRADMHLLHVLPEHSEEEGRGVFYDLTRSSEGDQSKHFSTYAEIKGGPAWKEIHDYAENKKIDVIVLMNKKKSLWQRIVEKSTREELILHHTAKYILVIP